MRSMLISSSHRFSISSLWFLTVVAHESHASARCFSVYGHFTKCAVSTSRTSASGADEMDEIS